MPFMFDLELPGLTPELGRTIEQTVADAGAWPVRFAPGREERRWFGIRKSYPTVLEILTADGRGHVLVEPEHWNENSWEFRPDAVERVAQLVEILARLSSDGFTFRATWAGSPIEQTVDVTPADLAELVRNEHVNDHTAYRVGVG